MLKRLVAGEYSLKSTFWMFGLIGFLIFNIIVNISQNSVLRLICPYGKICSKSIVLYILQNIPILMTRSTGGLMTSLAIYLIIGAIFCCYMIIVLRGLWKTCDAYEGPKFWAHCSKLILVSLSLLCFKSLIL